MIKNKIQDFLKNKEKSNISKNVLSLTLMNGVTFLTPLLLIPYLMRVLGPENYGVYIFCWTFISYFVLLVNYGYDLYATKEIAIHKNDNNFISHFFYNAIFTRLFLALLGLVTLGICIVFVPEFNRHKFLILSAIGVILGQSIHPTWIFQGMQEMKFISIITIITRVVPIFLIFLFVNDASRFLYVMIFQSVGYLLGGIVSLKVAIRRYSICLYISRFEDIIDQLKYGWTLFISTIGTAFYRESNVMILGFVSGNYTIVGYFSLADKFLRLFQMTITPIGQALFPHFGTNFTENIDLAFVQLKKISNFFLLFLTILFVFLFAFCGFMTDLYLGGIYPNIILDIRILSFVILTSGFSYLYGVVGLINLGKDKLFTRCVIIAGILNVLLCFIMSKYWADIGAAISVLISESILCGLILFFFNKIKKIRVKIA